MIHQRRFRVKMTVEIDAVTCPGVWLCPYGRVELIFRTLGYHFKTGGAEARFPLLFHEKFHLDGFYRESGDTLAALEARLACERVDFALYQRGTRLAFFTGQLGTLLRSATNTCHPEIHAQVLMRPTQSFPGVISPKIQLMTRVQVLEDAPGRPSKVYYIIFNANVSRIERPCDVAASQRYHRSPWRRQRPVCHVREATEAGHSSSYPHHFLPICQRRRQSADRSDDEDSASCAHYDEDTSLVHKCPFQEVKHSSASCEICLEYRNRFSRQSSL
ncbi:uncharacterized protein LOC132265692 [Phlebotomus argentipes]|uniref:uncharacterized protein LOC132265692 n=1 Tax=Phlebotomus argentipes TaxID=94469 RepID=UPI002892FDB5|nr:uncharacterized protein LOC132265692 [Phlebotomus argentipes]